MSVSIKIALPQPHAYIRSPSLPRRQLPPPSLPFPPENQAKSNASLKFAYKPSIFASKNSTASPSSPICCLLAEEGNNPSRDNLGFRWDSPSFEKSTDGFKSFEKATDGFKQKSVEELFQKQIRTRKLLAGGGGKNPPGGNGGRGTGGGGDEGSFGVSNEALQVILATIGFIFMYVYLLHGLEMNRLAKDYVKFLLTGTKSARMKRLIWKWESFLQFLLDTKESYKSRLLRQMVNVASRFSGVAKYRHRLRL